MKQIFIATSLLIFAAPSALLASPSLLPQPNEVTYGNALFCPLAELQPTSVQDDPRLAHAIDRLKLQLRHQYNVSISTKKNSTPNLFIEVAQDSAPYPQLGDDESYKLTVENDTGINISAETVLGALYALQTLRQLAVAQDGTLCFQTATINDAPRFQWRGIMIDVVRHWIGPEHIKRQLDLMAMAKFNVLHLHLSDDQGFRLESKRFPKLHELGSDGNYFTQNEMRDIIDYAADRGIRVVPEFGLPGHSRSLQIAYPFLAINPAEKQSLDHGPLFSIPLDPTKDEVYAFINELMEEITPLFPDAYFHIGGDEAQHSAWEDDDRIAAFMEDNDLATGEDLQAYFSQRYYAILTELGKTVIGWNEMLHPDLPRDAVIHMWNKTDFPEQIAEHQLLLSTNYYFDHFLPSRYHYRNDPLSLSINGEAAPELANNLLGVEVAAWAEIMDDRNIDMCLWPRALGVAERLWSMEAFTKDEPLDDFYTREAVASNALVSQGARFRAEPEALLRELVEAEYYPALKTLADVITPVPFYHAKNLSTFGRYILPSIFPYGRHAPETMQPFTRALAYESMQAREFELLVDQLISEPNDYATAAHLLTQLNRWIENDNAARKAIATSQSLTDLEIDKLSTGLKELALAGKQLVHAVQDKSSISASDLDDLKGTVDQYYHMDITLNRDYLWHTFKVVLFRPPVHRQHKIAIQPTIEKLLNYVAASK